MFKLQENLTLNASSLPPPSLQYQDIALHMYDLEFFNYSPKLYLAPMKTGDEDEMWDLTDSQRGTKYHRAVTHNWTPSAPLVDYVQWVLLAL